jgi:hypothetical protein
MITSFFDIALPSEFAPIRRVARYAALRLRRLVIAVLAKNISRSPPQLPRAQDWRGSDQSQFPYHVHNYGFTGSGVGVGFSY